MFFFWLRFLPLSYLDDIDVVFPFYGHFGAHLFLSIMLLLFDNQTTALYFI